MPKQTVNRMILVCCISVALISCKEKTEIIDVVRPVKTLTVSEQAGEQIRKFSGLVAAAESSDLSFEVAGQVSSVAVDIGDRVTKGQVLAVLDPEPYQLDVEASNAELVKAKDKVTQTKAQYDRQKRIYEQGAGVKSRLDIAEYEYKAAGSAVDFQVAKLDQAKRNLSKTELISPYDGTIASRSVQPHEEVQAGQKVLGINASGEMEIHMAVPETSIDRIHIGDAVLLTFSTLPEASVKGRISYVGSAADQANSFPVKVAILEPNEKIKPGMTAEASFTLAEENREPGYTVPIQAILPAPEANQGHVFVYNPKTSAVTKTLIRFHGSVQKNVIVYEGLKPGDIIVVAGVGFLADGMKVKLMKQ